MSTDQATAYSYCPGGTGKKIKFCCRDLVPELSSVFRMIGGEQHAAALQHLDRLLAGGKERPCVLAVRGLVLATLGMWDEMAANAQRFLAKYPNNRVALADMAMALAGQGKAAEALPLLLESLAKTDEVWEQQIFEALLEVAKALSLQGRWAPTCSLLRLALQIDRQNYFANEMLRTISQMRFVPLLLKETFQAPPCPAEAPWKKQFDDLAAAIEDGRWCKTADRFVQFAQEHSDCPAALGLLVSYWSTVGDAQRCREAADRFAAMVQDWEDAAEALAVAMLVGEDPLGDAVDILQVEWTVSDPQKFEQAMLENPCVVSEPVDYRSYSQSESPPPKAIYRLLDRPPPSGEPTVDNVALQLAEIEYYGRQTDRPAKLRIESVRAPTFEVVKETLLRTANGALEPEPITQCMGQDSAGMMLLSASIYCPIAIDRRKEEQLYLSHMRRAMLEHWPDQPLGVLGGLTPRSAVADPAKRLLVQAAIKVLESFFAAQYPLDFNELRAALGLEIAPPVESLADGRKHIPLIRLHRVVGERFSIEQLHVLLLRAVASNVTVAAERLASAILDKPEVGNSEAAVLALLVLAKSCQDPQQQLEYICKGRETMRKFRRSDYTWDLLELPNSLARRDIPRFKELFLHLVEQHFDEPMVQKQLQYFMGVMESIAQRERAHQQPAAESQPAERTEGLWMPGQNQGSGGKLWTPDE